MSNDMTSEHETTVALATELMESFGRDMEGWYDRLHDDIVMEFPFGPTVGMTSRFEGKTACAGLFKTVCDTGQMKFSDIRVAPMANPSIVIVEYAGDSSASDLDYHQTYISMQGYRDGKLIWFKEYFDTAAARDAFGNLGALES